MEYPHYYNKGKIFQGEKLQGLICLLDGNETWIGDLRLMNGAVFGILRRKL